MADPPGSPDPGDMEGMQYDRESTTVIPRWVKLAGIITAVLALLLVVVLLIDDGHGPARHGGDRGNTPPVGITGGDHTPPAGGHG